MQNELDAPHLFSQMTGQNHGVAQERYGANAPSTAIEATVGLYEYGLEQHGHA